MVRFSDIVRDEEIKTYIQRADESLIALGYTEHSFTHVGRVATLAGSILLKLGYSERDAELARIAGYLHDIGNIVNRSDHAQSGAIMAFELLRDRRADPAELATIVTAIGNHDESTAFPVNHIAAAIILADKTDVRRSRVRNSDVSTFDIHDRVNYSVTESVTEITDDNKEIQLRLHIDTQYCSVMDYFEIFIARMTLCRKAADALGMSFRLFINDQQLL